MESIVIFHKDHQLDPNGVNAGAETATILLAKAFAKLGLQVAVAAQLPAGLCSDGASDVGVVVDGVTYLDLTPTFDVQKVVYEIENDLGFACYHLIVASRAQALLELRNNPKILSKTFITHEPSSGAFGIQAKALPALCDNIISVSEAQKQLLVDAGCAAAAVTVVPNGADTSVFAAGDVEKRDYQRIVFAGALVIDKGVHLLIEAFSRLQSRYPGLKLDIYGSSGMWGREPYFDMEQAKQVPGLTFHGAVSQSVIAGAFQEAGLLALPSLWFDSFPLTAVEAQVSGLPVLGSSKGGMKEIIQDGVTGVLLKEINTDSIAEQLERLISNPERLRNMSRQSLARIRATFTWENTAKRILELISKAGDKKRESNHSGAGVKVGLLSTWNQECGLATYARYLVSEFSSDDTVILAEDVPAAEQIAKDERNVRRCWKRLANNYDNLLKTIEAENINVLHLNCHYRFFNGPVFARFLQTCRSNGVAVISHIHNPYTLDIHLEALVKNSDTVIVHTEENRLEVIANGADPKSVAVVEHGVRVVKGATKDDTRKKLGIPANQEVAVCFGFIQAHKGVDQVISAVAQLSERHPGLQLYVVGGVHEEDQTSKQYYAALKDHVLKLNLQGRVRFLGGFVAEETVDQYLVAADVVLMNYLSQHYEASGAVARALGCGAAIITSSAPPFARLESAVMHITSGYPLVLAMHLVLSNAELQQTLRINAKRWANKYSWQNIAGTIERIYAKSQNGVPPQEDTKSQVIANTNRSRAMATTASTFKVLMQNRHTALSHPGGDTVVMERVASALRELGAEVDIDLTGEADVSKYDIVHIHNFATPEVTERFARNCVDKGVPYVVTTMYEDLPVFYNQMLACYRACSTYIDSGQPKDRWAELINQVKQCQPSTKWENPWTAANAGALISTGKREQANLRRDYPTAKQVEIYHLGCDITDAKDGGELFRKETGLSDFVLCVGRLETRKNQLMLLRALEDSELPVVFATGGFTYQKEYEDYCRKFKRRGATHFLGRMDKDMLSSAFAAAKVHALPSWYELPGIVSLEAARYGTNIVVADLGTERDYFGDYAMYCKPDEAESIHNAVLAAFYSPAKPGMKEHAERFTWANAAKDVLAIYAKVTDIKSLRAHLKTAEVASAAPTGMQKAVISAAAVIPESLARATQSVAKLTSSKEIETQATMARAIALCDEGDELVKEGKLKEAMNLFARATESSSAFPRAYRSCGVVALNQMNTAFAEECFRKALELAPNDCKSLTGLGACRAASGDNLGAIEYFVKSLDRDATQANTIAYLINASYAANKLDRLEDALGQYCRLIPNDLNMLYCLAGCYYKQEKCEQAAKTVDAMLKIAPAHIGAVELRQLLAEKQKIQSGMEIVEMNGSIGKSMALAMQSGTEAKISQDFPDPVQAKLTFLEELKREQKYEMLLQEVEGVLSSTTATKDQRALALLLKGEAAGCAGDFVTAVETFKGVPQDSVHSARALVGQGAVLANAGQWGEAEELFTRALSAKENDNALAGLAMCAVNKGDKEGGWDYYRRSFIVNPENIKALCGLVQLGYTLNRLDELDKSLRMYLDLHPANLSILYAFAGCLYAQNKQREAVSQLEKIMLFDPNHALAIELMAKINAELSNQPSVNF